jgi:DNA-binding NarL/FixJ family response regulator
MEGIDAAHAIRQADPAIGVVVLSQYADESYAFELFKNGTDGLAYLLKDRVGDLRQLLSALRAVASGGSVVDPQVIDALDLASEQLVHRRVAAVLTFLRDAGLRPRSG